MTLDKNYNKFENNSSESYQISLLEERLKITRHKQKVGEVIISKQVNTKMVNIPLRKETLVVKRIGKKPAKLTEVKLSEESINGFNYDELNDGDRLESSKSNFLSLTQTKDLLEALSKLNLKGKMKIRLEIINNCSEDNNKIIEACDQYD